MEYLEKTQMVEIATSLFPVKLNQLKTKSQDFRLVKFRGYLAKILYDTGHFTDTEIGELINRSRTNVCLARQKLESTMSIYNNLRHEFMGYKSKFKSKLEANTKFKSEAQDIDQLHYLSEEKLLRKIFEFSKYTKAELTGRNRKQDLVKHRYFAIYVLRLRGFTYKHIGEMFNRDHSTIMYAYETIIHRLTYEPAIYRELNFYLNQITRVKEAA